MAVVGLASRNVPIPHARSGHLGQQRLCMLSLNLSSSDLSWRGRRRKGTGHRALSRWCAERCRPGTPFRLAPPSLIRIQFHLAGARHASPNGIRAATSPLNAPASLRDNRQTSSLPRSRQSRFRCVYPRTGSHCFRGLIKAAPFHLVAMTRRQSGALHCRFAGSSERSCYRGVKHLDFVTDRDRLKRAQA